METTLPISELNPHFDRFWVFDSEDASCVIPLGIGLIKSLFESSSPGYKSRIFSQIRNIKSYYREESEDIDENISYALTIIEHVETPDNSREKLEKLKKYFLLSGRKTELVWYIDFITKALLAKMNNLPLSSLKKGKIDFTDPNMLQPFCNAFRLNVRIMSKNSTHLFKSNESGPLITLQREDNHYGLLFKQYEQDSDFNQYPFTLVGLPERNSEELEGLIELLADGLDASRLPKGNLDKILELTKRLIQNENIANKIMNELSQPSQKNETFTTRCGITHNKDELLANCLNNIHECPCGIRISKKDVDSIRGIQRNRGGNNSIKNAVRSIDFERESSNDQIRQKESPRQELEKRLDCKHKGIDPINCSLHKFCLQCRYDRLDKNLQCHFCSKSFDQDSKVRLWETLLKKCEDKLKNCSLCFRRSFLVEKQFCVICGLISKITAGENHQR